jgi:ABC-type transport system involved in multi-copper enzyme maturation permease subunit
MLRLAALEFFKLRNTRYFWVLSAFFLLFLLSVPIASKALLDYLGGIGESISDLGILASELPIFDFVDIWQNLTWVYKNFSILLGFIVVISVCNEYSYGTVKQNVIDGLSRREYLWSKISFIIAISAIAAGAAFIIGLIMGMLWSPVKEFSFIIKNLLFIPAYFFHLVGFQLFCLLIAVLIRRSGFVLALLIFYIYVIERIAYAILRFQYELNWIADLLPLQAIGGVIPFPFGKYALQETQSHVAMGDMLILFGYIALIGWLCFRVMTKRDLG